jgi:hypothetical protein
MALAALKADGLPSRQLKRVEHEYQLSCVTHSNASGPIGGKKNALGRIAFTKAQLRRGRVRGHFQLLGDGN